MSVELIRPQPLGSFTYVAAFNPAAVLQVLFANKSKLCTIKLWLGLAAENQNTDWLPQPFQSVKLYGDSYA